MGEEKPAEEKKAEEVKKVAEEKKEEAPKAAEEGKKEEEAKAEPPPPQEIVLKVFMHCEGCARKVRRCLKGFEGVENVITDCRASKVVVKGERADPVKVFKRVQRKSHRQVELISPIPKPPTPPEVAQKQPEKEEAKPEEKKAVVSSILSISNRISTFFVAEIQFWLQPSVITVVLGVYMHCDACAQEIRKRILRMKGIESAEANLPNSQVTVKGVVEPKALADYVYKKTGKHATIVEIDSEKKAGEEKPKEEKKEESDKSESKKPDETDKDKKSGDAKASDAAAEEEDLKMELRKSEMYYHYYPQQFYQHHRYVQEEMNAQTQLFSDENPNACAVM